ncbi:tyrosine-type recombinase/integrase [Agathobacter sp.]
MSEIMVRERFLRSGKKVYEYSFEMASVDGKRKRKSKSGFASKRDARIAGRKALSEYENVGQVMVDRDISYADFLDLWMENDCKLTCKESTLYGYEKKIRLYLKPELGGYRVSSIDKKILQTFITDLYNDGFSINTIISIKGLLTKSFNYALENHYIMTSPANRLVIPQNMQPDKPTRRKEHIYLTKHPITKAVLAPMKAVKKMLVLMEIHLDASIDKLDNLAMDVQLDKEKHMENAKAQKQTEPERAEAERVEAEVVYAPMVAEPQEYQYNADAFEARGVDEVKQEAAHKEAPKVRDDKAR